MKTFTQFLNELSKPTLTRYVKAAVTDKSDSDYGMGSIDGRAIAKGHETNSNQHYPVTHDRIKGQKASWNQLEKRAIKRGKGISNAVSKLAKEDVEQIDELSKALLRRYLKATDKSFDILNGTERKPSDKSKMKKLPTYQSIYKRMDHQDDAEERLRKEEVEQIDELSKKTLDSYIKKASSQSAHSANAAGFSGERLEKSTKRNFAQNLKDVQHHMRIRNKRQVGVMKATDKLVNEAVEQLDELSRKTLASYTRKAATNMAKQSGSVTSAHHRKLSPSKYLHKYGKRFKGIQQATSKLSKEDVELTLDTTLTEEQFRELIEASRTHSLAASDKHVNLAQDAEHRQDWTAAKKHWKNAALASIKHDAAHGRDRSDKLKVRGYTMRKEAVEQIDEGNKENKQKKNAYELSVGNKKYGHKYPDKHSLYIQRLGRAELNKPVKDSSITRYRKLKSTQKEAIEQIDELSDKTLKSYIKKGAKDMKTAPQHKKEKRAKGFLNAIRSKGTQKESVEEAVELLKSRKDIALALIAKGRQSKAPAALVKKK